MKWQAIVIIVIWCLNLGISLAKHGEYDEDSATYSFWKTLINIGIQAFLLITGGFFSGFSG